MKAENPHRNQPVNTAGRPLEQAKAALILIHGRGAMAVSILTLAEELAQPDFIYLAPQAAGVLSELGGDVTMRLFTGMGHTINQVEIEHGRAMMKSLWE